MTNDIRRRVFEHKSLSIPGFSKKYKTTKLIYYETFGDVTLTIAREKEIKRWRREKKENLISILNPDWNELKLE